MLSGISTPYNITHTINVKYDPEAGFQGLPPEWKELITTNIPKEEVEENPEEAIGNEGYPYLFLKRGTLTPYFHVFLNSCGGVLHKVQ